MHHTQVQIHAVVTQTENIKIAACRSLYPAVPRKGLKIRVVQGTDRLNLLELCNLIMGDVAKVTSF